MNFALTTLGTRGRAPLHEKVKAGICEALGARAGSTASHYNILFGILYESRYKTQDLGSTLGLVCEVLSSMKSGVLIPRNHT